MTLRWKLSMLVLRLKGEFSFESLNIIGGAIWTLLEGGKTNTPPDILCSTENILSLVPLKALLPSKSSTHTKQMQLSWFGI